MKFLEAVVLVIFCAAEGLVNSDTTCNPLPMVINTWPFTDATDRGSMRGSPCTVQYDNGTGTVFIGVRNEQNTVDIQTNGNEHRRYPGLGYILVQ